MFVFTCTRAERSLRPHMHVRVHLRVCVRVRVRARMRECVRVHESGGTVTCARCHVAHAECGTDDERWDGEDAKRCQTEALMLVERKTGEAEGGIAP
jgi:hypothetical protein